MFARNGSLQRRLTSIFIIIVIIPLMVAGYVVQHFVNAESQRRAAESLPPALATNVQRYNDRVAALPELVQAAVGRPALARLIRTGDRQGVESFLRRSLKGTHGIDYLVVLDRTGRILGSTENEPSFDSGFGAPAQEELSRAGAGDGFVGTRVPVRVVGRGTVGSVAGGFWLDDSFLVPSLTGPVGLAVVAGDRVISSTRPLSHPTTVHVSKGRFNVDIGGEGMAQARRLAGSNMAIVASTLEAPIAARSDRLFTSLLLVLGIALVGALAFAYLLARIITRPLDELSESARAISQGRFDHRIRVRSRDEIGRLAVAFNEMTERLDASVTKLQESRDQLRQAVLRVGETLRSTHDMRQMLEQVLYAAAEAVDSDAAIMWMVSQTRDQLTPLVTRGINDAVLGRISLHHGIAGSVVESGLPLVLPSDRPEDARYAPAPGEPRYPNLIGIPLRSQSRVIGVLTVYRRSGGKPFSEQDIETVAFLGEQAGVAIENVMLHEEAQLLSLTDGLTGLWNRRYFEMQFSQVLATAVRFDRPFSVLMLDLDRFKEVNDAFGHQVGDGALIEFARRVRGSIREVDTLARYGGEEFICLLSETNLSGAITTAEKIHEEIGATPVDVDGQSVSITVSVGVASYPDHGDTFAALVDAADRALYRAKQEGRDRVSEPGPNPSGSLRSAT